MMHERMVQPIDQLTHVYFLTFLTDIISQRQVVNTINGKQLQYILSDMDQGIEALKYISIRSSS